MQIIKGRIQGDKKTKKLVKRLQPGEIALIDHKDIDEVAARSLVEKKIKAVLNTQPSISGKYPNLGPSILLQSGITLIDHVSSEIWEEVKDGQEIIIKGNNIFKGKNKIASGQKLTLEIVKLKMEESNLNFQRQLEDFAENTLHYAKKELDIILKKLHLPPLKTHIKNKQCLIVVRGQNYKKDLQAIKPYIYEKRPVIIGVDGGADAVLEEGITPDIILGDMDSVSDKALNCGAEIVVHAYPDGSSPGLKRIQSLGLKAWILPAHGTSEDVAMLLAYEKDASLIVAVGTHSNVIDFLEKGRKGMASTFLVRLKVGNKLVDARGVSQLYKQQLKFKYVAEIVIAALIPFSIVFITSPPAFQLVRLLLIKLKMLLQL
ncbi:MAG: hypothetical protein PWQ96_328 [Clostridia bacterium]|nr:hypothetical protein [Clostridia bacterium]